MTFSNWLYENTHGTKRISTTARPAAPRSSQRSQRLAVERLEQRRLLSAAIADFAPVQTFAMGGSSLQGSAVGDFNGDGRPDLVVADFTENAVRVLLSSGSGGFEAVQSFASGGSGTGSVAVGDFNGDGRDDIAVSHNTGTRGVGVLLGDGLGGFADAIISGTAGLQPFRIAVGDFNNDGKADIATANLFSNSVSVLLGNGDGSLAAPIVTAAADTARSLAVGDFNGDGTPDVAVVGQRLSVLLGQGNGSFFPAATFATDGLNPQSVAIADLDNNGTPDIAVANANNNSVSVFFGDGTGGFANAINLATGASNASSVALGDFNGDGANDIVVANLLSANVSVLQGNGDRSFAPAVTRGSGGNNPNHLAVADFNADGRLDIAVLNGGNRTVGILFNTTQTNQPPVNTLPGDQTVTEDASLRIEGLSVSDDDSAGVLTSTFTVAHGKLSVINFSGFASISGNGTATLSLTGTQAQINATLGAYPGGLTYTGIRDFNGLDTLTMTTTDAGGLSATNTLTIHVLSAAQQADLLAASITNLAATGVLAGGQATALTTMLGLVQTSNGQTGHQGFYYYVNGLINANILTQQQGTELLTAMSLIRLSLA